MVKPLSTANQSKFTIRQATRADARKISALLCPLVKKYVTYEFNQHAEQTLLNSMNPEAIAGYLEKGFQYFIAEANNRPEIIGVLGIKDLNHLYHLFVAESYHQQGIAKSLWAHYLELAKPTRVTVNSSHYALDVYLKIGFKVSGKAEVKQGISSIPMVYE